MKYALSFQTIILIFYIHLVSVQADLFWNRMNLT